MSPTGPPLSPITVPIRGKDRPIRFSINALKEFERELGYSIITAFAPGAGMKVTDLLAALHIGVKHGANGSYVPDRDKFTEWVETDLESGRLHLPFIVDQVIDAVKASTFYRKDTTREETEDDEAHHPPLLSGPGVPPSNPDSTN